MTSRTPTVAEERWWLCQRGAWTGPRLKVSATVALGEWVARPWSARGRQAAETT